MDMLDISATRAALFRPETGDLLARMTVCSLEAVAVPGDERGPGREGLD